KRRKLTEAKVKARLASYQLGQSTENENAIIPTLEEAGTPKTSPADITQSDVEE
nr:hypothetical protein [Tanacetum cinerariifolium]